MKYSAPRNPHSHLNCSHSLVKSRDILLGLDLFTRTQDCSRKWLIKSNSLIGSNNYNFADKPLHLPLHLLCWCHGNNWMWKLSERRTENWSHEMSGVTFIFLLRWKYLSRSNVCYSGSNKIIPHQFYGQQVCNRFPVPGIFSLPSTKLRSVLLGVSDHNPAMEPIILNISFMKLFP